MTSHDHVASGGLGGGCTGAVIHVDQSGSEGSEVDQERIRGIRGIRGIIKCK